MVPGPLAFAQAQEGARVLARASFPYPLMAFLRPEPERRAHLLAWLFWVGCGGGAGAGPSGPVRGLAVWGLPGGPRLTPLPLVWALLHLPGSCFLGMPALGPGTALRTLRAERATARRRQEVAPRCYGSLDLLGVDPDCRGQGLGTALLRPILDRAEREGIPCDLETSVPAHLPVSRRLGFRGAGRQRIPGGGPGLWGMLRP